LNFFSVKRSGADSAAPPVQIGLSEKNILDILGKDEVHLDELIEKSQMPVHALMTLLTDMELSGLIEKLPANYIAAK
jgi:predicted Rossmann fold nucleotide-binding protein DprA/Smf involved in DNA uptake